MIRWMPRALVALTILLCLGVGGYAGQVWWARRVVSGKNLYEMDSVLDDVDLRSLAPDSGYLKGIYEGWIECPWSGRRNRDGVWIPKRAFYEGMSQLTGQILPNDPSAWEAWFKAHPNLVWDDKQKRLVEGPVAP